MDEPTTTNVVVFLNDRLCSECEHHMAGPGGVFCHLYREDIVDEKVAAECPEYQPVPWAKGRKRG